MDINDPSIDTFGQLGQNWLGFQVYMAIKTIKELTDSTEKQSVKEKNLVGGRTCKSRVHGKIWENFFSKNFLNSQFSLRL